MSTEEPTKAVARRGRPPKSAIEAKKPGNRGVRGRPPGDAARIAEFKARLLATSGEKVIDKVIQIAQNDEHQGQMAALKMCLDRLLPLSLFEKDAKSKGSSVTVVINNATASPEPERVVVDIQAREIEDSSDA